MDYRIYESEMKKISQQTFDQFASEFISILAKNCKLPKELLFAADTTFENLPDIDPVKKRIEEICFCYRATNAFEDREIKIHFFDTLYTFDNSIHFLAWADLVRNYWSLYRAYCEKL